MQTLSFDFIQLDEDDHIINRQYFLSSWKSIPEAFQHDTYYPNGKSQFYRPLHTLSFMLDVMPGISSTWSHSINILLHLVVSLLVFWLFLEMGISRTKALILALAFALHPVASRIVGWVPGRNDATFALFAISSFIAWIRLLAQPRWWLFVAHGILFVAALMTKELGVVLPLLYAIWYLQHRQQPLSRAQIGGLAGGWLALGVLWFALRSSALQDIPTTPWPQLIQGLWSNFIVVPFYIQTSILPFRSLVMPTLPHVAQWTSWLALAVFAVLIIVAWRRRSLAYTPALFGGLWFVLFLLPSLVGYASDVRPVFFEHRAYVPTIGFLLVFASISWKRMIPLARHYRMVLAVCVLVFFGVRAFRGARDHKDALTFWTRAVAQSPQYAGAHKGLSVVYANANRNEEAMQESQKTLELNPLEKRVHNNIGVILLKQRRVADAETEFLEEIKINPTYPIAHNNLGFAYAAQQRFQEAERAWLTALSYDPWYALPHQGLAIIYAIAGNREQSLAHINALRELGVSLPPDIQSIYDQYSKQ